MATARLITFTNETEPTNPILLSRLKQHLQIPEADNADELVLQSCLDAAIEQSESYANIFIRQRDVIFYASKFESIFELFGTPINNVVEITYNNGDEVLNTNNYDLDLFSRLCKIHFVNQPYTNQKPNNIEIHCEVGYTELPESVIQAVLLQATNLFEFREDNAPNNPLGKASKLLLNNYVIPYV
jgi:uncharacterized phiE125 gp8 family phage protein